MPEIDNQHDVSVVYEYKNEKGHSWSSQLLVEYENGQKTEYRKCVKCDSCNKSRDSSTSAMSKHARKCTGKRKATADQSLIPYKSSKSTEKLSKPGLPQVAKFVYEDNFPINKIVTTPTMQSFFKKLNFHEVTHEAINEELERQYHKVVDVLKQKIQSRNKKKLICLSFDKWSTSDFQKFRGVYLDVGGENFCLGLIHYTGYRSKKLLHGVNLQ